MSPIFDARRALRCGKQYGGRNLFRKAKNNLFVFREIANAGAASEGSWYDRNIAHSKNGRRLGGVCGAFVRFGSQPDVERVFFRDFLAFFLVVYFLGG